LGGVGLAISPVLVRVMFRRRSIFRKPSLKGRLSARLSPKRMLRHSLGLKAPRGLGWLTNPKRALQNRIYHRTSWRFCLLIPGIVVACIATAGGWLLSR
jgi:hypothetical protein